MFKKMASTITLAILLVFPTLTFAFGLGEIEIHSALNEPMNADIELIDFKPEQIQELQVSLASQKLFERVGVPRPYILTQLKFKPMLTASGQPVIRVTSKDSIREPFLTFLIDARWSGGKILREYTVLLDPPIFGGQAKSNIESPKVAAQPRAPEQSTAVAKPATRPPAVQATRPAAPQPAPQKNIIESPPPGNRQEQEVTVKRGDTLWSIAEPYAREKGVSVNQMMLAIQSQNPQGFAGNNINTLKSGAILRIPQDATSQYSSYEALQEVKRQWQAWKQAPASLSEQTPAVNVDAGETADTPSVTTETSQESAASGTSADSKLSILGEEDTRQQEGGEVTGESVEALRNQVNLLKENVESKGEENQELLTRIESLESMLEKQEEIIKLQNDQLAQLQNVAGAGDSPQPITEETEVVPEQETAPEEAAVADDQQQLAQTDASAALSGAGTTVIPRAKVEPLPDFSGPIPDELLEAEESQTAAGEPVVVAEETAKQPESFFGQIMAIVQEQARNLIIGAGVLLVLILAWVAAKRRSSKEDAVSPSGLPEMDDDLDDTVVASPDNVDKTLDQLEPVDSNGMREPSIDSMNEDADRAKENEAAGDDVLAEADVYISYNLYDQAEELLKDAIQKNPSNLDYQVKLAEVYEGDGNQDGFVGFVKSIAPDMDKKSSAWSKIAAIGATLVPGHDLFADQADDSAMFSSEDASYDGDLDDHSLEFSMEEASQAESSEQEDEDEFEEDSGTAIMEAAGMDFGVDHDDSESSDSDANATMSFSMDDLEEQESGAAADDFADQSEGTEETEAFNLDDDSFNELNEARQSQEENEDDSSDDDNDVFIDLDQDSLEKELTAESGSDFDMDQADEDSSGNDDDLDSILNGTSETSIMKVPDLNEDSSLAGEPEADEDTVSLEQVQNNLTSELETLSFEDGDVDLENRGDDESSLPTLQTEELGRGDVDMDNLHDLDEDLTASETGTFEADMLAGEVTEQFDSNNLDNALDDLGDFANNSDDMDAPSVAEEVGTKLDLAKAFVDMGDENAAKETLTEVIDMGDETQIAEAKELLDKLP